MVEHLSSVCEAMGSVLSTPNEVAASTEADV